MRLGVPWIVWAAVMGIVAGAAKGEFDHMRLAHDGCQLPAQTGDYRTFDFELRREALRRAGIGGKATDREQILDRYRNALQRAGPRADCESGIGVIGASSRIFGRPLRIGHQLAAASLVI